MNPYTLHMTTSYVGARNADARVHLHEALMDARSERTVRATLARTLVRTGEWMMPGNNAPASEAVHSFPERTERNDIKSAA